MKRLVLALMLFVLAVSAQAKVVLVSFDGSNSLVMWKDTLQFARETNTKFTYFISAPYFQTESEEAAQPYWAKTELKAPLLIRSRPDAGAGWIKHRIAYLNQAVSQHCEIGSHLVGHYDGGHWTYQQWMKEMAYFNAVMTRTGFNIKNIKGIRAPYLGVNKEYFRALKAYGYEYDSSTGSIHSAPITQAWAMGVTIPEIPIVKIKVVIQGLNYAGPTELPFDCDFVAKIQWWMFKDTINAKPNCTDPEVLKEMKEMEDIFFDSLCYSYEHDDHPIQVCLHFEKRAGEPYYRALKRFVIWAKNHNAEFLTYSEYNDRVNK